MTPSPRTGEYQCTGAHPPVAVWHLGGKDRCDDKGTDGTARPLEPECLVGLQARLGRPRSEDRRRFSPSSSARLKRRRTIEAFALIIEVGQGEAPGLARTRSEAESRSDPLPAVPFRSLTMKQAGLMWPAWEQLLVTCSDVKFSSDDFPGVLGGGRRYRIIRGQGRAPIQEPQVSTHWLLRPT